MKFLVPLVAVAVGILVFVFDWPAKSLDTTALLLGHPMGLAADETGAVIITGCSKGGLGRDAAESLARDGKRVFCSVRKQADADEINSQNLKTLTPLIMDVTKEEQVATFVAEVLKQTDQEGIKIAGVVNNAGISRHVPIEFGDVDDINAVLDVNLHGVVRVTQAFLPALRRDQGRVVNIGSVKGLMVTPDSGAYSYSKFALEALTDTLRLEMVRDSVSVSMVNPGFVKTQIGPKQYSPSSNPHRHLTKEQVDSYGWFLSCYADKRKAVDDTASPPAAVTSAIEHALFSAYPRYRYIMGTGGGKLPAWVAIYARWYLPRTLTDFLIVQKVAC